MTNSELDIWELREILTSYGDDSFEYIVTDYQRINHGQPSLTLLKENDGNIYAVLNNNEVGEFVLCQINSKEHLIELKKALLGHSQSSPNEKLNNDGGKK